MNRFDLKFVLPLLLAGAMSSCVKDPEVNTVKPDTRRETFADADGIYKGWIRIKINDEAKALPVGEFTRGSMQSGDPDIDRLAEEIGATEVVRVFNDGGRFAERRRKYGLHLWYDIRFDEDVPVSRAKSGLDELPWIEYANPIPQIRLSDESPSMPAELVYTPSVAAERPLEPPFDDPMLPDQWHYNNDGRMKNSVVGADINAFEAWKVTAGRPEVIVAVMDQGVEWSHPDLEANMWVNEKEFNGTPGVDDDGNGYIDDIYGWNSNAQSGTIEPGNHGTHVAGTVAAVNNNGIGVCGVAGGGLEPGDGVRIMSVQNLGNSSRPTSADVYAYAADNGAVISQNSWVYSSGNMMTPDLSDAWDYFIETAGTDENGNQTGPMKGGVIICAAGNNNSSAVQYPAADPRAIAVTAMNPDYSKAMYSNYGVAADIYAPGGASTLDDKFDDMQQVLSTDLHGSYAYMYGTSMACPHVSGIAALIVSHYGVGNPGFTAQELKDRLLRAWRPVNAYIEQKHVGQLGAGLVDAGLIFIDDSGENPGSVSSPKMSAVEDFVRMSWTVPADGNGMAVAGFRLDYTATGIGVLEGKEEALIEDVLELDNSYEVGGVAEYTWTARYNRHYDFKITAIDRFGRESGTVDASVETGTFKNERPSVDRQIGSVTMDNVGEEYALSYKLLDYFTDSNLAQDDMLSYTIENRTPEIVTVTEENGILKLLPVAKGIGGLSIIATDLYGEIAQLSINYEVLDGPLPPTGGDGDAVVSLSQSVVANNLIIMAPSLSGLKADVTIWDAAARKMMERSIVFGEDGQSSINISDFPSGTYTLAVRCGDVDEKIGFIKK